MELEQFLHDQENSRNKHLKTGSRYKQNNNIRQYLASVILQKFEWNYWVTFTFGFRPHLDEVEDVLYKLWNRVDHRILKHTKTKSLMTPDERSVWILFPEIGSQGLHYHGFLKLNSKPNITGKGYSNEWDWMRSALRQNLDKLSPSITTLRGNEKLDFKLYNRSYRNLDNVKMIIYSMKQYGKNDFDRFNSTIISPDDWKPILPIYQRRTPNKIDELPLRPNKWLETSLSQYLDIE